MKEIFLQNTFGFSLKEKDFKPKIFLEKIKRIWMKRKIRRKRKK